MAEQSCGRLSSHIILLKLSDLPGVNVQDVTAPLRLFPPATADLDLSKPKPLSHCTDAEQLCTR